MWNSLIGCWMGNITYQNVPCSIIINIGQDKPYVCISIPEINIWNIPHYFCNISDEVFEFSLWDNNSIGKCNIINNDHIVRLILTSVPCINEKKIILNKTDCWENSDIVCGDFLEIDKYQVILKKTIYVDVSEFDVHLKYKFVLEHPEYKNLHSLLKISREKYNTYTTFETVISLMRLIHKITASSGISVYVPPHRSGYTLLRQKLNREIGLNCRGVAIVLNDTLLSMGIHSKFICCMSRDAFDPECHVTNCVYIPEWKKWIMLDSAIQAYITDDNGNVLNIPDVKDRIMNNEKIIFMTAPGIVNQKLTNTNFERYLAKNMYAFFSYETYIPYCDDRNNRNRRFLLLPQNDASSYKNVYKKNIIIVNNPESFFN